MAKGEFPYLRFDVRNDKGKIIDYAFRPMIPVQLSHQDKSIVVHALVDSGADHCIFPADVAEYLGHRLKSGEKRKFQGIGGDIHGYLHQNYLKLLGKSIRCNIYFSEEYNDFGLLGQREFFSNFKVTFDYKNKKLIVKT